MKKYLTFIAAAMMATACQNDDSVTGQLQTGDPIKFSVAERGITRAPGEVNTKQDLALTKKPFGVFASFTSELKYENTTVKADYMYNQKVMAVGPEGAAITEETEPTDYVWEYAPVKYWPNSTDLETGKLIHYTSFFAYWPYEANPREGSETGIIDMSKNTDYGDPWINFRLPQYPWGWGKANEANYIEPQQVDLMYGVKKMSETEAEDGIVNDELFFDQQKPNDPINDKVNFIFRHALACFADSILIKYESIDEPEDELDIEDIIEDYASIEITKLTITYKNLCTKGRLVLNSPSGPNWKEIISGELTTERVYVKDEWAEYPDGFKLKLSSELSDKEKAQGGQVLSVNDGLFYIPMVVKGCEKPYAEITINYILTLPGEDVDHPVKKEGTATTMVPMQTLTAGHKEPIHITITKNLDLLHIIYQLPESSDPEEQSKADGPSWSREIK